MTMDVKELIGTVNSVNVGTVSLSRKEAKTLAQNMASDEAPLLLCITAGGKIVLTTENLFFVKSRLLRTAKVDTVSLDTVKSIQEKRGLLLARINIITTGGVIKLSNVSKKASTKLIGFLQGHENIAILPVKKAGIFETAFKLAIAALFAFILKDITCGNAKRETSDQRQLVTRTSELASFTPAYTVLEEKNLTLYGVQRYEQRISVPLGLSEEELKQNLLAAAWKLQKDKNAVAVVIFAFRGDDMQRNGGYTAGKCTIAPFGDWAKAVEVRTPSNLREEILISEAYFDNTPIRANGSKAFIYNTLLNANGASLHKIDSKQAYTEDIITELKNGTEVSIIGNKREFTMYGPLDMYKVQVKGARKAASIGWVYGSDLSDTPNGKKVKVDMN